MSVKKNILGAGLVAGSLISVGGDSKVNQPHNQVVQKASIKVPSGIENTDGYQELVAARKNLVRSIERFSTEGMIRVMSAVGVNEFRAGGELFITPKHGKKPGRCEFHSNGKVIALPELHDLLTSAADVMQAQYNYNPCQAALKASPKLAEPYNFENIKDQLNERMAPTAEIIPALPAILCKFVDNSLKDFCTFSNDIPTEIIEHSQVIRQAAPNAVSKFPADLYTIPELPTFNNVPNGQVTITVENPKFHDKIEAVKDAKDLPRDRQL